MKKGLHTYYDNESDNYKQNHLQLIYSLKINNFLSLHTALHYTKGKGYYEEYREDQSLSDYGLPAVSYWRYCNFCNRSHKKKMDVE